MENYYLKSAPAFSQHDFAIIDRIKHPNINTSWPVRELVSPMLQPQAHFYPWFLSLKDMNSGDWNRLIAEQENRDAPDKPPLCCLLLRSEHSEYEVYSQLIDALIFTDEKLQRHILRYYDPQVLFHLSWMFTFGELAGMIPVRQISYWTCWLDGRWNTLAFPSVGVMPPPYESKDNSTVTRLQNIGIINSILSALPPCKNIDERLDYSRCIEMLLIKARELGLNHRDDLHIFAQSGVNHSLDFWKTSAIQDILKQSKGFPELFNRKIRCLSEYDWQVALAQLKQQKVTNNGWE